jgi:hypothetical protein
MPLFPAVAHWDSCLRKVKVIADYFSLPLIYIIGSFGGYMMRAPCLLNSEKACSLVPCNHLASNKTIGEYLQD